MVRITRSRVIDNWTMANRKQLTSTWTIGALMKQLMDGLKKCVQKWKRNKNEMRTNTDVRQVLPLFQRPSFWQAVGLVFCSVLVSGH